MIEYRCPKCAADMASPDGLAGQAEKCPDCGHVTTVPNPFAPPPPSPPPSTTPRPAPLATAGGSEAEQVLWKANPAMFRNRPIGFIVCLVLIPVAGIGLLILAVWWLQCKATTLTITNRRSTLRHGILAKHTNEVRHSDVRNLRVVQHLFGRIFGVGMLEIATAGHAGVEIVVSGLPGPQHAADLIREHQ